MGRRAFTTMHCQPVARFFLLIDKFSFLNPFLSDSFFLSFRETLVKVHILRIQIGRQEPMWAKELFRKRGQDGVNVILC
jgi:hypothetical protein